MILLLDTSTLVCKLRLTKENFTYDAQWEANRELAMNLLKYLKDELAGQGLGWDDIEGIGAYRGPGSFTGLRIGLTVLNTLADSKQIPIVGETGEDWQERACGRLRNGENDRIVLPNYGGEANITKPRK